VSTRKLERTQWKGYFDKVSRHLDDYTTSMLVTGLDLGAQPEIEGLPLVGLTYDPDADTLDVIVPGLDHRIDHPRSIWVQEDDRGRLLSFAVTDDQGHEQIVATRRHSS
jgi:hypothetical protein